VKNLRRVGVVAAGRTAADIDMVAERTDDRDALAASKTAVEKSRISRTTVERLVRQIVMLISSEAATSALRITSRRIGSMVSGSSVMIGISMASAAVGDERARGMGHDGPAGR
jgi:transcriptional regulator NrdR family protein